MANVYLYRARSSSSLWKTPTQSNMLIVEMGKLRPIPKVTQLFREHKGSIITATCIEHLLCICIALSPSCIFLNSYNNEIVSVTISILQLKLLKPRKVKWLVRGHTAS